MVPRFGAHHFCLNVPEKFSQPGNHFLAKPCMKSEMNCRMGEVTRYGVKSVAGGVKKLQRRMGRTYQQGWDRAKSGVNRQVCCSG